MRLSNRINDANLSFGDVKQRPIGVCESECMRACVCVYVCVCVCVCMCVCE